MRGWIGPASGRRDPKVLSVNRHTPGALVYFDAGSFKPVYEPGSREKGRSNGITRPHSRFPPRRYPLFANNIGKTLSQPERCLIQAYTSWVGDISRFAHHPLKESGLYTDPLYTGLLDPVRGKSVDAQEDPPEAIGQLYDYQRHYERSPRLAVLLPARPQRTMMELFRKRRIIVVWRSRGASFTDSKGGILTTYLRDVARSRDQMDES